MPPYANHHQEEEELDHSLLVDETVDSGAPLKNVPVRYKFAGETDPSHSDGVSALTWNPNTYSIANADHHTPNEPTKPPSLLERLLDFNPCTGLLHRKSTTATAPASPGLFQIRRCAECGFGVHKFKGGGYRKEKVTETVRDEMTGEAKEVERKLYYHSVCLARKEYRKEHRVSFAPVLVELLEVVEFMVEERKKRQQEEEEARERERIRRIQQQQAEKKETSRKKKSNSKAFAKRAKIYLKKSFSRKSKVATTTAVEI